MADDERQCPVCSAIFATDAALGSHLAVCVGRARAEAKRPPPKTEDDVDDARGRVLCYVCGQRVLTPASLAPSQLPPWLQQQPPRPPSPPPPPPPLLLRPPLLLARPLRRPALQQPYPRCRAAP